MRGPWCDAKRQHNVRHRHQGQSQPAADGSNLAGHVFSPTIRKLQGQCDHWMETLPHTQIPSESGRPQCIEGLYSYFSRVKLEASEQNEAA